MFVHYYNGIAEDTTIAQARIFSANPALITQSHQTIANRVAECNRKGKKSTFQKMINAHGLADSIGNAAARGGVALYNNQILYYDSLRAMQQKIIDSCASTVIDEFLQCFGGQAVDEMKKMDTRNKATIYANSASDSENSAISSLDDPMSYLTGKINSLYAGNDYPTAVVNGKLAYDAYLNNLIDGKTNWINKAQGWIANNPGHQDINKILELIEQVLLEVQYLRNLICKSQNATLIPMKEYCEWKKFVVPPGGQLEIDFESDTTSCANVTIYRIDPETDDTIKVRVWNWNNPQSQRFQEGNQKRVVNGSDEGPTTFLIHNDAKARFVMKGQSRGNQNLDESPSNAVYYPGFSFGGRDESSREFHNYIQPWYFVEEIDRIPISLNEIPARMGDGFVNTFGFSFNINPTDPYWTNMILTIDVAEVLAPGVLEIVAEGATFGHNVIEITEPGRYELLLGDMTLFGDPFGFMEMNLSDFSGLQFSFDSWGLTTIYEPPVYSVMFFVKNQKGEPVSGASVLIPGYGEIVTADGIALIELPDGIYTATVTRYGHDTSSVDFIVQGMGQEISIILNRFILELEDLIILAGDMQCFESEVGIELNFSVFESGSVAGVVAGSWINIQNTHVQSGAEFHAYIDENGVFCDNFFPVFEKTDFAQIKDQIRTAIPDSADILFDKSLIENKDFFRIYPNPTTGNFILELLNDVKGQNTIVEVYTMFGSKIIVEGLSADKMYQFDLTQYNPGIYLIKVICGNNYGVEKLIKQ